MVKGKKRPNPYKTSEKVNTKNMNSNNSTPNAKPKVGRPEKPMDDYISTIFEYNQEFGKYVCTLCPKPRNVCRKKGISTHLKSQLHRSNTHKKDIPKLDEALTKIEQDKEKNDDQNKMSSEHYYLKFLAFMLKNSFSFEQIESLGKFLNQLAKKNKVSFFAKFSFDAEEISKVTTEFGRYLLDDLKSDLASRKYSVSIDNSTVSGTSICGVKVRYLKQYEQIITGSNGCKMSILKNKIENKIIGIKYLKSSSDASVMLDVLKEKLFGSNQDIKDNLIGITHDLHPSLVGSKSGLVQLLNKEINRFILDLDDPCHCLALCFKKAIETLRKKL